MTIIIDPTLENESSFGIRRERNPELGHGPFTFIESGEEYEGYFMGDGETANVSVTIRMRGDQAVRHFKKLQGTLASIWCVEHPMILVAGEVVDEGPRSYCILILWFEKPGGRR